MKFNPSNYHIHWIVVLAIITKAATTKYPGVLTNADLVKRQDFLKDIENYLCGSRGWIIALALDIIRKEIADIEMLLQLHVELIGVLPL